jgi:hypothetical protein
MLNDMKTDFEIVSKSPNQNLIFVKQNGGEITNHTIGNIKYYYNVEYAKPIDKKYSNNEIFLLTVNEGIYGCGVILINNDTREANIQSVSDYADCIVCDEQPAVKYKVGAILMQIIIHECKKFKIRKITLEDNSKKSFTGSSIELIYYRTMAQGTPYYTKFGFKNTLPLIVRNNEMVWKKNPSLKKNLLIETLEQKTTKSEKKLVDLFKKILAKYKDNVIVSEILINLFEKAVKKEEEITEKRNKGEIINFVNSYAKILYLILKKIYILSGYEPLPDNKFMLFLR